MSQPLFDHNGMMAIGNVALNNDLLLSDEAAINLANGHLSCDNRSVVGQNLIADTANLIAQQTGMDMHEALMASNARIDSNNNPLGSNGSLSGGSSIGSIKPLYGNHSHGLLNGGSINLAIGSGGHNLSGATDTTTGSSSGSPSPLMMKPQSHMQYYQQQWQQQQQHQQQQQQQQFLPQHRHNQLLLLQNLQEQQRRMHQNSLPRSGSVNPIAAQNNHGGPGESNYHFKTLVPAVAAGAIIGKGGETIAALQKETNARVKMSKSHDFYPGTMERICLITGSAESIMNVLEFIMEKIREKPDLSPKLTELEQKQSQERDKQVKILVPNSTAGMIIGKAGTYIKQIKEDSGSYVQISQKPKDITLQERCITIIGEKENNKIACKMILQKIVDDPQSGSLPNVSYADVNGPVANYNPIGSPYAMTQQNSLTVSSSTTSLNSAMSTAATGASLLMNGSTINLSLNLGSSYPNTSNITQPIIDSLKLTMRRFGHPETAANEVSVALTLLAKYGVTISVPSHSNGNMQQTAASPLNYLSLGVDQSTAAAASAAAATMAANNANNTLFNAISQSNWESVNGATSPSLQSLERNNHSASLQALAAASGSSLASALGAAAAAAASHQQQPQQHLGQSLQHQQHQQQQQQSQQQGMGGNVFANKSPTPGDMGPKDSKKVEIPELIVGAILGPGGRSLTEIQHRSGANIQISSKGIFAPGTKNRIVKISGQPKSLTLAQFLIEQKITEEETKRARQSITSPGGCVATAAAALMGGASNIMGAAASNGIIGGGGGLVGGALTNLAGVMQ